MNSFNNNFMINELNSSKCTFSLIFPPNLQFFSNVHIALSSLRTYRHLAAKVGTSKGGGKQWQTSPKILPRMHVPEPHRSHDWALVPASPASKVEY